jgi:hypothetical protein
MLCLGRRSAGFVLFAVLAGLILPAAASDTSFPFGSTLLLDVAPMQGSRRVPMIEIDENGAVAFHLWCANALGTANVADDTITIVPNRALPTQCTPDVLSRDAELLAELSQVTGWRRHGDVVDFLGATPLRFRLMTN